METIYHWEFNRNLIELIKTSLEKENKPETILKKVKDYLRQKSDIIKHNSAELSVSKEFHERSHRSQRCFDFIKSGFFERENLAGKYLLSSIKSIDSFKGEKYQCTLTEGRILELTKRDYYDLYKIL